MDYKTIIGIDQSKLTVDAGLLYSSAPLQVAVQQFENNPKGFVKMFRWIKQQCNCALSEILICTENTGLYSYPLSVFCQENNLALWMESALQIKKSLGIQRGKNDRIDAKRIANYAFAHRHAVKLYKLPAKTLLALKQMMSYRERLVESRKSFIIPQKGSSQSLVPI